MGTGQNCTKTKLHEGTKLYNGNFALRVNLHHLQFCTEGLFCMRVKKNIKKKTENKKTKR